MTTRLHCPKTTSLALDEHKQLFGFQPSRQYTKSYNGKASATRPVIKHSCWKKKTCLTDCQQTLKPTPQEKISLAKIGLETREKHIMCCDNKTMNSARELWKLYTALSGRKFTWSVEIEPPLNGHISVQFLKHS